MAGMLGTDAVLMLEDGRSFWGQALGRQGLRWVKLFLILV